MLTRFKFQVLLHKVLIAAPHNERNPDGLCDWVFQQHTEEDSDDPFETIILH